MTMEPRRPNLFKYAFSPEQFGSDPAQGERFKSALAAARENARLLSGEIATSLPQFTQHDVTHMDALWELADLIGGDDLRLNPAEAFVLGTAMLVHDLAMSHAAYVLRGTNIREHSSWPDMLARRLRAAHGRAPNRAEMAAPPEQIAAEAEQDLIRAMHGESAERLSMSEWTALDGSKAYLIPDTEIRVSYGRLVGKIAASHHWEVSALLEHFATPAGAISSSSPTWTVDSLLLACLLRTADAAHIDASRAPDILAFTRGISGASLDHWKFQSKLQRPYIKGDRLVFTAPGGFSRSDIQAWWLAYDVLRMIDGELHSVDSILADTGRPRLRARGVAQIESPRDCQKNLPCTGWEPVAARVQVSDVAGLVRRLGAEGLYGSHPTMGIRELLTNACDAVAALTALHKYRGTRLSDRRVDVSAETDANGTWLIVADNGIGMTREALTTALLDFGRSSWLDPVVASDNPGLLASSFEPIGKYGIGFFSSFMLGKRVEVTSRARSAGPADTWILEFGDGLQHRPTLRRCETSEELGEPGTRVRVLLDPSLMQGDELVLFKNGASFPSDYDGTRLGHVVPWLLPAPAVDVWTQDLDEKSPHRVLRANDWIDIPGVELLRRVAMRGWVNVEKSETKLETTADALQVIHSDEGVAIGRIAPSFSGSVVTAGPARTETGVHGVAGILLGQPNRAARDSAMPLATSSVFARWATEQAEHLAQNFEGIAPAMARDFSEALGQLGGNTAMLPQCETADGWLNFDQLTAWIANRDKIHMVRAAYRTVKKGLVESAIDLAPEVIVGERESYAPMSGGSRGGLWPSGSDEGSRRGVGGWITAAIAGAWGITMDDAASRWDVAERNAGRWPWSKPDSGSQPTEAVIGTLGGENVVAPVMVISRK